MPLIDPITLSIMIRTRVRQLRQHPEAGYSTETALVTALLVILAIAVIGILALKITRKAEGINLSLWL